MSVVGDLEAALAHYPLMMTVEEAAEVLRVSRAHGYVLARRYEASGGTDGIPVLHVGNCLRVPKWALIEFLRKGRLVRLRDAADRDQLADEGLQPQPLKIRKARRTSRHSSVVSGNGSQRTAEQLSLLPHA
ncbi:MAG: helix-turn-helix domain-containing protein [Ilumatobacteraceae bacterium]